MLVGRRIKFVLVLDQTHLSSFNTRISLSPVEKQKEAFMAAKIAGVVGTCFNKKNAVNNNEGIKKQATKNNTHDSPWAPLYIFQTISNFNPNQIQQIIQKQFRQKLMLNKTTYDQVNIRTYLCYQTKQFSLVLNIMLIFYCRICLNNLNTLSQSSKQFVYTIQIKHLNVLKQILLGILFVFLLSHYDQFQQTIQIICSLLNIGILLNV